MARVGSDASWEVFRSELAWREFCAEVLWRHPDWSHLRCGACSAGQTGYPLVDAGMRQGGSEGWMHNRVRMVTASFLVKDLHIDWRRAARLFLDHLVDGDHASNDHGWQWVAGTGTDAAPFYRIFNPVLQAERFDPERAEALRRLEDAQGAAAEYGPGSR